MKMTIHPLRDPIISSSNATRQSKSISFWYYAIKWSPLYSLNIIRTIDAPSLSNDLDWICIHSLLELKNWNLPPRDSEWLDNFFKAYLSEYSYNGSMDLDQSEPRKPVAVAKALEKHGIFDNEVSSRTIISTHLISLADADWHSALFICTIMISRENANKYRIATSGRVQFIYFWSRARKLCLFFLGL